MRVCVYMRMCVCVCVCVHACVRACISYSVTGIYRKHPHTRAHVQGLSRNSHWGKQNGECRLEYPFHSVTELHHTVNVCVFVCACMHACVHMFVRACGHMCMREGESDERKRWGGMWLSVDCGSMHECALALT